MRENIVDWFSAKLFQLVHSNSLVYNTCWEDPAIDRIALDLGPNDRIVMLTSAGCNALDYVLKSPKHIYAVDVNPRQNALLDLKIAGIRALDFETFFAIFGRGRLSNFRDVYRGYLRPQLAPRSQDIWDRNLDYFTNRNGFYYRGASGAVARMINYYIDLTKTRSGFEALLRAESLEEQHELYHSLVKPSLWNKAIRWAVSTDASLSFVGVPRPQRQQVEYGYAGGIAKYIEDCVEAVFTKILLKSNYFWSLYLQGEYTRERCPEYLKEENFRLLKQGLVDRISTHTDSLAHFLDQSKQNFSRFVLLDHMDWLSTYKKNVLHAEWQGLLDRAEPNARVIWRSGGMKTDFVDVIPVEVGGRRRKVGDLLTYHRTLAAELHARDRVHTYSSFYIADVKVS